MRVLTPLCALMIAASACSNTTAEADDSAMAEGDAGRSPSQCGPGERRLPKSRLCQREAAALLLDAGGAAPGAMQGCAWVIRETPFALDMLLYRTLRCGKTEAAIELHVGNHMSELTYARRAGGGAASNADGKPLVLARIFAGSPDGRARALREARDSMQDAQAAPRCELKSPYRGEGLPGDALIVDVARTQADLERGDAVPECGSYGYNPAGGSIDFWRTHQGYAWFFTMGTDVWDVDPGSFTVIGTGDSGAWEPLAARPRAELHHLLRWRRAYGMHASAAAAAIARGTPASRSVSPDRASAPSRSTS